MAPPIYTVPVTVSALKIWIKPGGVQCLPFCSSFPQYSFFALPGVIAAALFPERDSKTTFITLLNEFLPVGVRGLLLAALLSALIGSSLSVMNSISTLVGRDFLLQSQKKTSERRQVSLGRIAILISTPLAIAATYLIYITPEGLYTYLQAISIYLVMPIPPAIFFGILSKRVTVEGAIASVLAGSVLAVLFVSDQLIGAATGAHYFLWLHRNLTLNYTYRGLWGTIAATAVLFLVSAVTKPKLYRNLEGLTVDWSTSVESFGRIYDWRLQLAALAIATIALYA